jgi:uncharacterized Zn finger protein
MYGPQVCLQLEQSVLQRRLIEGVNDFVATQHHLTVTEEEIRQETPDYLRTPSGIHERAETMRLVAAAALRIRHGENLDVVYDSMLSADALQKRGVTHALISKAALTTVLKGAQSDADLEHMKSAYTDAAVGAQTRKSARDAALAKKVAKWIEDLAITTKRSKSAIWADLVNESGTMILAGPYTIPLPFGRQ